MYLYLGLHVLGHDTKFFLWITSQNIWKILSVSKEYTCNAGDPGSIPGSGRSTGEGIGYPPQYSWASLVTQLVKSLPTMQETWVWFLGWEYPRRRERLPTPVFWPRKFHGLYSPWGRKESDTTERFSLSLSDLQQGMGWAKKIHHLTPSHSDKNFSKQVEEIIWSSTPLYNIRTLSIINMTVQIALSHRRVWRELQNYMLGSLSLTIS